MGQDKTTEEQHPLVSVVMCSYNVLPFIREAVDCILHQQYSNLELLIGDDGSGDGTREWLSENLGSNPRVRLFFHEHNIGYLANKNFLHQQAHGVYVTQLDSDDTCPPQRLAMQIQVVLNAPEIKMVGCGYTRIDTRGVEYERTAPARNELLKVNYSGDYPFWFPSLLVHQSVFQRVGYFDPYFAGAWGDDSYWTRTANSFFPIYCLSDVLYNYRNTPGSITNLFDDPRKLVIPQILADLHEQRRRDGKDWLSVRDYAALKSREAALIADDEYMSEQYRTWSAKAIDKNQFAAARGFLWRAFKKDPGNFQSYRTLFYGIRKYFRLSA